MFEINGLFQSCVIAIDHSASGSTALCFQQIAVVNWLATEDQRVTAELADMALLDFLR
jgi:hypothetical protein